MTRFIENKPLFLKVLTAFTVSGIPYTPIRVVAGIIGNDNPEKCRKITSFLVNNKYLVKDRRGVLPQLSDKGFYKLSELVHEVRACSSN